MTKEEWLIRAVKERLECGHPFVEVGAEMLGGRVAKCLPETHPRGLSAYLASERRAEKLLGGNGLCIVGVDHERDLVMVAYAPRSGEGMAR